MTIWWAAGERGKPRGYQAGSSPIVFRILFDESPVEGENSRRSERWRDGLLAGQRIKRAFAAAGSQVQSRTASTVFTAFRPISIEINDGSNKYFKYLTEKTCIGLVLFVILTKFQIGAPDWGRGNWSCAGPKLMVLS